MASTDEDDVGDTLHLELVGSGERRRLRRGTLSIGGDAANDWVLAETGPAATVSRHHCRIEARGGFHVTDLGSTDGTWLNGRQLPPHSPEQLGDGGRLRVGSFTFVARVEAPAGSESLALVRPPPPPLPDLPQGVPRANPFGVLGGVKAYEPNEREKYLLEAIGRMEELKRTLVGEVISVMTWYAEQPEEWKDSAAGVQCKEWLDYLREMALRIIIDPDDLHPVHRNFFDYSQHR